MKRTRSRATLLLLGAVGATLMTTGQAHALGGIGFFTSLPFDKTCANNGQLHLPPVTNTDIDLGRQALGSCRGW